MLFKYPSESGSTVRIDVMRGRNRLPDVLRAVLMCLLAVASGCEIIGGTDNGAVLDARVAYLSSGEDGTQLRLLDAATGEVRILAEDLHLTPPSVSPDGSRLAVARVTDPVQRRSIVVVNVQTGKETVVARDLPNPHAPQWLPQGDRIITTAAERRERRLIYLIAPDGSEIRTIDPDDVIQYFHVAPEGRQIVFSSSSRYNDGLFVLDLDSQVATRVTDHYGTEPRWSPDGRHIAYTRRLDLQVLDVTDQSIQQVTDYIPTRRHRTIFLGDRLGEWSPEGLRIAFHSDRGPAGGVFVVNVLDGRVQRLSRQHARDRNPTWTSDGNYVIFTGYTGAAAEPLFAARVRDGGTVRLTEEGRRDLFPVVLP